MSKRIKSPILAGIVALLSILPNSIKGELKEIVQPHLGVYECTEVRYGSQDLLGFFEKMDLELRADETFVLHYRKKGEKAKTETGRYQYDRENGSITLLGGPIQREFPLQKGVLNMTITIGGETFTLKFEQKA